MPAFWHGIPTRWQQWLQNNAHRFQFLRPLINRGLAVIANISFSIMWFDPTLHQLSLVHPAIRTLEVTLLVTGGFFLWYHITRATPQLTPPLPTIPHMFYCALGAFPLKFVGLIFLFSETTLYTYPVPNLGWLSMSYDHSYRLGGAIIWMLGGVAYTYSAGYFMRGWFDIEESKPDPPRNVWDDPELLRIPGFD
jgi:cytochrome c oxidase assembly factor CtaG